MAQRMSGGSTEGGAEFWRGRGSRGCGQTLGTPSFAPRGGATATPRSRLPGSAACPPTWPGVGVPLSRSRCGAGRAGPHRIGDRADDPARRGPPHGTLSKTLRMGPHPCRPPVQPRPSTGHQSVREVRSGRRTAYSRSRRPPRIRRAPCPVFGTAIRVSRRAGGGLRSIATANSAPVSAGMAARRPTRLRRRLRGRCWRSGRSR